MLHSAEIAARYREVLAKTQAAAARAGRPDAITLIAVSKKQPEEAIEALYRLGHRDFGENYVQELVAKAQNLATRGCPGIRWHLIGHLQTNKVKLVIPHLAAVHTVDSVKVASALATRWRELGRGGPLPVFIEVNIDAEAGKAGVPPEMALGLAREIATSCEKELQLQGLMCIPEPGASGTAQAFRKLRELETACRPYTHGMLSMGMTQDFESAIAQGATHVRVGTAIFGQR